MESQLLEYGSSTYSKLIERKANKLSLKYLNEHLNEDVVPLKLVVQMLKDIELRLEVVNTKLTSSGVYDVEECIEILDELYQDI